MGDIDEIVRIVRERFSDRRAELLDAAEKAIRSLEGGSDDG
jgi:hypothetical protein